MIKAISLGDEELFGTFIGKRVVKKEVFRSTGEIPLYSANVFQPFGYVEESNIGDFNHDYVLWGIDGNFEFNARHKGEAFATTDHCGAIEILSDDIVPEYLVHQLEVTRYQYGFDRTLRASLANIRTIAVDFPTDANGRLDKDEQMKLVGKCIFIRDMHEDIATRIAELRSAVIEIEEESSSMEVALSEILEFPETNSGMTEEFCQRNPGVVPVYGCSMSDDAVLGHIKEGLRGVKYYKDNLTWNRNGSVGLVFYRQGQFTTNEDHRVMVIKQEYEGSIDPHYLRHVLQNEIRKLGYGYTHKLGKARMAEIKIKIPVTETGTFDLDRQRTITEKYEKAHGIKDALIGQLQELNRIVVSVA